MPWVGLKPTIPEFERAKTVHTLDRTATVIGHHTYGAYKTTTVLVFRMHVKVTSHCKGRAFIEGVWEQGAKENIETYGKGSDVMKSHISCTTRQILRWQIQGESDARTT
jgi:hypothetical protein